MSTFKKIFGLAGAVVVFTGLASAQVTCTNASSSALLIRVEGTTEQVADLSFTCSNPGAAAQSVTILSFLSLPVTSKVLSTTGATAGQTEASVVVGAGSAAVAAQGTVSGNQLTFAGVSIPAGAANTPVVITNVRVNATSLSVGSGAPPAVTETVFISGGVGVVATALNPVNVAFALPGISNARITGTTTNPVVCAALVANGNGQTLFTVSFNENFPTAFKAQGGAANNTLGSEFTSNTETGFVPPVAFASGGSNIANSGTRVKITLANIPTGATVYVPITLTSTINNGTSQLRLVSSETGAANFVTASTANNVPANNAAVTVTSGGATLIYEAVTSVANPLDAAQSDSFSIPVSIAATANTITQTGTPITATVSLAPTGATSNIPNFVVGTATALNGSQFNRCSTTLLFPYVVNTSGFDTGLAISNTSADPFGTVAQAGTCALNFYGTGAPNPSSITTASVAAGTTYTQVLSAVAAGFSGYMIAQCNFQFGHGFAFVTNGIGPNGGLSQGYLALVLPSATGAARALGAATETLGQ